MFGSASSGRTLVHRLIQGACAMKQVVEDKYEIRIALKKVVTVASTVATHKALEKAMGKLVGNRTMVAANLGIDSTAGGLRQHAVGRKSKMRARWFQNKARAERLRKLAHANRATADKVFRTGLVPSVTFGTQVWGASDSEILEHCVAVTH